MFRGEKEGKGSADKKGGSATTEYMNRGFARAPCAKRMRRGAGKANKKKVRSLGFAPGVERAKSQKGAIAFGKTRGGKMRGRWRKSLQERINSEGEE